MTDTGKIKLHVMHCGTMSVSPTVPYGGGVTLSNSAAQVFSRKRVTLPCSAYLIEHPKGLILVDTGWCRDISPKGVYDEKAVGALLPAHLAAFYHPELGQGQAVHEQLAAMGIKTSELDYVLLTHLDPDHVSGVRHLLDAKRILLPEDEYFWNCRTVYRARQPVNLWMDYPMEHFYYRGSPIGPNRWAYDVLGDESVLMVNVPGHTDGMCAVLIRNGKRYVLLTADAAFSGRSWQELIVPGFGFDEKLMLKSLKWVREMALSPDCAGVFASHDAEVLPQTFEF